MTRRQDHSTAAPCEAVIQRHGSHLRQSDSVECTGVLAVELGQLSEETTQTSIVGARPNDPHGEDGAVGHLRVAVMGKLAQGVHYTEVRVGDRDQAERQGHGPADHRLTILQLE